MIIIKNKEVIDSIQKKFLPFLENAKEVLLLKTNTGRKKEGYCVILTVDGIQVKKHGTASLITTSLTYKTGIVEKNKTPIQNGLDLIFKDLEQLSKDFKKKHIQCFRRS